MEKIFDIAKDSEKSWGTLATAIDGNFEEVEQQIYGFEEEITIDLGAPISGKYYGEYLSLINYSSSPTTWYYNAINVEQYIGKKLKISIDWHGSAAPSSWAVLCGFRNDDNISEASLQYSGITHELECYNKAVEGRYSFEIEITDKFLCVGKRYEQTEIQIAVIEKKGVIPTIQKQLNEVLNRTIFVSTEGDDNNDGLTIETALASFAKALSLGTNIKVKRGVYNETFAIVNKDNITIMPYDNNEEYSHEVPCRDVITIRGTQLDNNVAIITNCNNLHIEEVVFDTAGNSVLKIVDCNNVVLNYCQANNSVNLMGFEVINTNAVFNKCYSTKNKYDGFNFHGYGTTILNDCISEYNNDDGCSHHDGCVGTINGGVFEGNGKCGIAPAYGAKVNVYSAICKDNKIGIGYLSTPSGHTDMKGIINSCVMVGNASGLKVDELCSIYAINCKYNGNTTDKQITGTLVEYE